jgi:CitB family two-component system response regulator MalR
MNLLIVDDDSICNYIYTRVAATSGLFKNIRSVHNGKDALQVFDGVCQGTEEGPDVILLDLNMPLMNGFDFITTLRELKFPGKEQLSIVILTSSENPRDLERAQDLGIEHYLVKSVSANDLQQTIFSLYNKITASKKYPGS